VVSPDDQHEFVACPTFLMDDRDRRSAGCRARFFAERSRTGRHPTAWPPRDTEHVDNAAFMAEHPQMARTPSRGEAPHCSVVDTSPITLGDADTAIAYVERPVTPASQRHVPDPEGNARAGRDDGVDPGFGER
jgi:hypothetical protein